MRKINSTELQLFYVLLNKALIISDGPYDHDSLVLRKHNESSNHTWLFWICCMRWKYVVYFLRELNRKNTVPDWEQR